MSGDPQWYFAYGSNILSDVFVQRRKIQPLKYEVATIQTHTLCFNVMGMPYTDPGMGGLRLIEDQNLQEVPVCGVAYLLTSEDMQRVIVTEGCGLPSKLIIIINCRQRRHCLQHRSTHCYIPK